MLLCVTLLVLAASSDQSAAPKPALTLQPPWTTLFSGESANLTCGETSPQAPGNTTWYREGRVWAETPGQSIPVQTAGVYTCRRPASALSDPVTLTVSGAMLILQAPPWLFEGDLLTLHCRSREGQAVSQVTYHWDGQPIRSLGGNGTLPSVSVRLEAGEARGAGEAREDLFHCSAIVKESRGSRNVMSQSVNLQVKELFPSPVLRAAASVDPREGSPLTLTCDTRLDPLRPDSRLLFSFLRDNRTVRGWDGSPEHRIPAAQSGDSGSYRCEAATDTKSVWKRSPELQIRVQRESGRGVLLPCWLRFLPTLATGILFAVDTGLYVVLRERIRFGERSRGKR
ncbi:Fc receptor-like protein 6 [Ornithorhynchus anatinus]|uniref:Fc receptor-like protein 6 n=1 Tax=Ornithorhynchus anatinus TaxID=9258 RepID=UPI0007AA7216|nr:Fc receptor-like protein 6 [Ornithorhynchus anatinus]